MKKLVCSCFIVPLFLIPVSLLSQGNFPAELVDRETIIHISDGKLQRKETYLIRINNREGDKYGQVGIHYSSMVTLKDIEGTLSNKEHQVIRKLKKSEITDRSLISDISMFEDHYVKEFRLKHSDYPYFIRYSYLIEQKEYIIIDDWVPVLHHDVPTLKSSLTLFTDPDYRVSAFTRSVDQVMDRKDEIQRQYRWEASYDGTLTPEIYSTPLKLSMPEVILTPLDFIYGIAGKQDSWEDLGRWEYQLNEGQWNLPLTEQKKIIELTKEIHSPVEKVRRLYHYMQDNTRYVNVTVDIGGLKTYPAEYVAKNKYGDCKALTNFFQAVLDLIGIGSYYCNIQAGKKIVPIREEFPGQQFNHAILFVPLESDTLWLDCTSKGPFNYLGTFTQGRYALAIGPEQSYLMKTPPLHVNDVLCERMITCQNIAGHISAITVKGTYRGEEFEILNTANRSMNESQRRQFLLDNFIIPGTDVSEVRIENSDRDVPEIELHYKGYLPAIYRSYGDVSIIRPVPFDIPVFEAPANRKTPVQIDYPVNMTDTFEIRISGQDTLVQGVMDHRLETRFGSYEIHSECTGEYIRITKHFILLPNIYETTDYSDFYNFITTITDHENNISLVTEKR
jgi:hypothetical protein